MYHVTPVERLDTILKEGLIPSRRPTFVADTDTRPVYLATSQRVALAVASAFVEETGQPSYKVAVLRVEVPPNVELYPDPDYPSIPPVSYMSNKPIPAENITLIGYVQWHRLGPWKWQEQFIEVAPKSETIVNWDKEHSLSELQALCREQELSASGDKKTLIRRLLKLT